MSIVNAVKMSTDEKGEPSYRCATIFCTDGNSFILDTPYFDFVEKWEEYNKSIWEMPDAGDSDNDLSL
jgi:hypothetical protein